MRQSIYDKYFQSLLVYTKNNPSMDNIVTVNIENLDGFVEFTFALKYNRLKDLSTPILVLNLNWDSSEPIRVTRKKNPINIENIVVNGEKGARVEYKNNLTYIYLNRLDWPDFLTITMSSVCAIIPLSESVPFNRYILHLDFRINEKSNGNFLFKINRSNAYSTKFTKGNYALAFPSRSNGENKLTNIYFDKQESRKYFLKMGFTDKEKNHLSTDIYSMFKLSLMILFLFIILYFSDHTILEILGGCLFIGVPLFEHLPDVFGHNRFKYYISGYDVTGISIVIIIGNLTASFAVFLLHINEIYSNIFVLLGQSIFLFVLAGILAILDNVGGFERYVCDMNTCDNLIRNRVAAYNCFTTGRVVCKKCMKKYCIQCNFYKGRYSKRYIYPCMK